MHIDMSQSVIHYNHYQSKDSVNCEHTLGDKKNALFTVQRFPRGILVDWLVLLLDHNFANTFQFSQFWKKNKVWTLFSKSISLKKGCTLCIAQGQLDVGQRKVYFIPFLCVSQTKSVETCKTRQNALFWLFIKLNFRFFGTRRGSKF